MQSGGRLETLRMLRRRHTVAAAAGTFALSVLVAASALGTSPSRAAVQPAPAAQLGVNWALSGTATASSTEAGRPASNAIDGDAGTDWCTDSWTGSLAVDLGQVRRLDGLGITLDASS